MTPLKAIILEDSISYVWDYEMILDDLGVTVEAVHKSWTKAIDSIKKNPPDFMIVDLLLEKNEKGLDFIEEVKNLFIPIIICTGYPEKGFLNQALENEVVAFFTKPLDKSALKFCIQKLIKSISANIVSQNFLVVREKGFVIKLPFVNILKIEIDGNYSYVITTKGKKFILKLSLKKLIEKLDEKTFIRCHRSTVVNVNCITKFDAVGSRIFMTNDEWIDFGSKFKNDFKNVFLNK